MAVVTMKSLLESGVHFGHQVKRWDPRMKKFIFAERNGIHIIDLQKTIQSIKEAYEAVRRTVSSGKTVLFVGTKKQAQQAVQKEAERCGMYYVNNRWLGGMLTNFVTIKRSLLRLKKLEKMEVDGSFENLTKKEIATLNKERAKLQKNLGGIKEMKDLPGILFVIDTRKEAIAVAEARRVGIPIIAVVDTNCNPDGITYPIPGNDDAIRAISLFTQIIANAVIEADNEAGLKIIETLQEDDDEESEEASLPEEDQEIDIEEYAAKAEEASKEEASKEEASKEEASKEEASKEEASKEEASKEEEVSKEDAPKKEDKKKASKKEDESDEKAVPEDTDNKED